MTERPCFIVEQNDENMSCCVMSIYSLNKDTQNRFSLVKMSFKI